MPSVVQVRVGICSFKYKLDNTIASWEQVSGTSQVAQCCRAGRIVVLYRKLHLVHCNLCVEVESPEYGIICFKGEDYVAVFRREYAVEQGYRIHVAVFRIFVSEYDSFGGSHGELVGYAGLETMGYESFVPFTEILVMGLGKSVALCIKLFFLRGEV